MGCFFYFNSFTDERKREDFPKKQIQIQVRVYLSDALFSTSPVYGHLGNTFFDAGPNMMNVAVSRARDSFIVIGNPDLFSEGSSKPSGILARHLRKKKSS